MCGMADVYHVSHIGTHCQLRPEQCLTSHSCCSCCCCCTQVAGADFELHLTGAQVTLTAASGLYAGNTYEVEVFVADSNGAVSEAKTTLAGRWPSLLP